MLSNKVYDVLKWICMIFLGAFGELYLGLSVTWNLPLGEEVRQTCHYLQIFLGACLGISAIQYKMKKNQLQVPMVFDDEDYEEDEDNA